MTTANDQPPEVLPQRRYVPWYRRLMPRQRVVAVLVLGLIAAPFIVRWWRLSQLPDVPLPFEMAAFDPVVLPAEKNAYHYFRQMPAVTLPNASQWYNDYSNDSYDEFQKGRLPAWADVPADVRASVEQAAAAIELLRQGSRCPDSQYIPIAAYRVSTLLPVVQELRNVQRMLVLDAMLRLEAGDTQGTAEELHDAFRVSRHVGRRGCWIERLCGLSMHTYLMPAWHQWSRDPRVTVDQLEAALARLQTDWKLTPPVSDQQKLEVAILLNEARPPMAYYRAAAGDAWEAALVEIEPNVPWGTGPMIRQSLRTWTGWQRPWLWLTAEPEVTIRSGKLWLTHELRYCDLPRPRQPQRITSPISTYSTDEKTAGLSATELDKRLQKGLLAQMINSTEGLSLALFAEAGRQAILETELRLQIEFRRQPPSSRAEIETALDRFAWPVDPCDPAGGTICHRRDDDGLVIWTRSANGLNNSGRRDTPPGDDDIFVTIPWVELQLNME